MQADSIPVADRGFCNGGLAIGTVSTTPALGPTTSSGEFRRTLPSLTIAVTQTISSQNAVSTSTGPSNTISAIVPASHPAKKHTIGVGVGVGVSVGVALLLLGIGYFFFRCRRPNWTISLDFWVAGKPNSGHTEVKKGSKGKDVDTSGGSIHSESLPTYAEATNAPDKEKKLVDSDSKDTKRFSEDFKAEEKLDGSSGETWKAKEK
jgi:hypothetical protein